MFSRVNVLNKLRTISLENIICKCHKTTDSKLNLFVNPQVQKILKQLTHVDFDKVFEHKKLNRPFRVPMYKLMTDEQLKQQEEVIHEKANYLLQMPPVLEPREEINVVLSKDDDLDGFDKDHSKYVFADISDNISNEDRIIVVREPNGILRKAYWDERQRVNQIYFPISGRQLITPKMFEEENFNKILNREEYKFILDRACIQFEPDDPLYVKLTRLVYDRINFKFHFRKLFSTRHFGSMTFYLVLTQNIDNMLLDNIQNQRIDDAYLLVKLYHLIHPECKSSSVANKSNLEILQDFIAQNAKKQSDLELALQIFLSQNEQQSEETVEALS